MTVTITRGLGETRRTKALADEIAGMSTPCVGCRNCRGLCRELIEAIILPEMILNRGAA
jgi:hypothetical protein